MQKEYNFYVYISTNYPKSVFYVGFTNSIPRRIIEHKNGFGCKFTKKYNLKYLIYFEQFQEVSIAIEREKEIKKWRREKKLNLVKSMNPNLSDLSVKLFRDLGITEEEMQGIIEELRENYKWQRD
jgi:putative endonuclease